MKEMRLRKMIRVFTLTFCLFFSAAPSVIYADPEAETITGQSTESEVPAEQAAPEIEETVSGEDDSADPSAEFTPADEALPAETEEEAVFSDDAGAELQPEYDDSSEEPAVSDEEDSDSDDEERIDAVSEEAEPASVTPEEAQIADSAEENEEVIAESEKGEELYADSGSSSGQNLPEIGDDYIEGIAYMNHRILTYDMPIRYIYSDRYFDHDSTQVDYYQDLATMSAVMADASSPSYRAGGLELVNGNIETVEEMTAEERYEYESRNIQDLMRAVGFENIQINEDYTKIGNPYSTGVVVGMKNITTADGEEYTLIGFFPRSVGYLGEWANNFNIGAETGKDHEGYSQAANDNMIPFLEEYLRENFSDKPVRLKIWSSGMSRGGALSSVASAYIDDAIGGDETDSLFGIDGVSLARKDLYTYTFGSPHAASAYNSGILKDGEPVTDADGNFERNPYYSNIHNFAATYDSLNAALVGKWDLDRYGQDKMVTREDAENLLDQLYAHYASINNVSEDELDSRFFMYKDEETGKIHYGPIEYTTWSLDKDGNLAEMDLAEFMSSYMYRLTSDFSREKFGGEMDLGLQFLGETYLGYPTEVTSQINFDSVIAAARAKGAEVAEEASWYILTGDIDALRDLVLYVLNPGEILPDIVLDVFENAGIKAEWNLSAAPEDKDNRKFPDEEIAREANKQYLRILVSDLVQAALNEPVGTFNMISASKNLWSAHEIDIYTAWQRALSDQQEYYLNPVSKAEAWGYRMIYLPDDMETMVGLYNGTTDDPDQFAAAIISDKLYYSGNDPDHFIHMTVDSKGNRILYLRADLEYTLKIHPLNKESVSMNGLSITEYEFMHSAKIFDPEYVLFQDDNGIIFNNIILNSIKGTSISDGLLLNIGPIPFKDEKPGLLFMKSAAPEKADKEHNADYYLLYKIIQLSTDASGGGTASGGLEMRISGSETREGTVTAYVPEGYEFLGWFLNGSDTPLSTAAVLTRSFEFFSTSELLTAKFRKIIPETSPSDEDVKPAEEIVVPVVENGKWTGTTAKRSPDTADQGTAGWILLFVLSLAVSGASVYVRKEQQ